MFGIRFFNEKNDKEGNVKTKSIVKVAVLASLLVILSTGLFADNVVRLSTYYPAPFGAYDRIKLVPREFLPLEPHCDDKSDLGTMYYNLGSKILAEGVYVCQRISKDQLTWVPVSGQYF